MDLSEIIQWIDGIRQLEETDLVLGGPVDLDGVGGISNLQALQLACRTAWLKDQVGLFNRFTDAIHISTTASLNASHIGKVINIGAACTLTLPNDENIPYGSAIVFVGQNLASAQATILAYTSIATESIRYSGASRSRMYLGGGDVLMLVKGVPPPGSFLVDTFWYVAGVKGNFDEVGEVIYKHKVQPNTVHADGSLLLRSSYPRLWEYASGLGSSLVPDPNWLSGGLNYSGCFSSGNGSTTFRVPDLRAMFLRGLDSGRGIDLGRAYNNAGGYEADEFKNHSHTASGTINTTGIDEFGRGGAGTDTWSGTVNTSAVGGTETRPKNIGLLPLIKC